MPKRVMIWSEARMIGYIWQPGIGLCAQVHKFSDYDLRNIGEFTRENVLDWLCLNMGDFQSITDFSADKEGEVLIGWADPENEEKFLDSMYPAEYEEEG